MKAEIKKALDDYQTIQEEDSLFRTALKFSKLQDFKETIFQLLKFADKSENELYNHCALNSKKLLSEYEELLKEYQKTQSKMIYFQMMYEGAKQDQEHIKNLQDQLWQK